MQIGVALGNLGLAMGGPVDPVAHADLVFAIADAAEALGFDAVWAGDHLALPLVPTTPYPYGTGARLDAEVSLLDPFAVLAALAGRTHRVGLGFGVLVLPYRHPLVTAKLVATIDVLSTGRVVLGVGTGWLPEEFAAVGADFGARGRATDDCLRYLRTAFATGEVDGMTVLPTPIQRPGPPIWVGGQSVAAIRRAVEFADVWDAPYVDPDSLHVGITRMRDACQAVDRDPATLGVSVRGLAADAVTPAAVEQYSALGVSHIGVVLPVRDPALALDALAALADRCLS